MANKKKNASANPNLDTVKDVFRKNRHITNRIQQKTVFEATDLSAVSYTHLDVYKRQLFMDVIRRNGKEGY